MTIIVIVIFAVCIFGILYMNKEDENHLINNGAYVIYKMVSNDDGINSKEGKYKILYQRAVFGRNPENATKRWSECSWLDEKQFKIVTDICKDESRNYKIYNLSKNIPLQHIINYSEKKADIKTVSVKKMELSKDDCRENYFVIGDYQSGNYIEFYVKIPSIKNKNDDENDDNNYGEIKQKKDYRTQGHHC